MRKYGKIWQIWTGHRLQNKGARAHCMLGDLGYKQTLRKCNTLLFRGKNYYLNVPLCYVIRTKPVLFNYRKQTYIFIVNIFYEFLCFVDRAS